MGQPKFLVVDLEATCDEGGRIHRRQMEIIEIGAVIVDPDSLLVLREFQTFVRPVIHTRLTPFCTRLTSITQDQVDGAPGFPEAIETMRAFLAVDPYVRFCSWGDYDRKQFLQDAGRHNVSLPFSAHWHINLKASFSEALRTGRRFGLGQAIQRAGLSFEGCHHRGIDDARNIARLMPYIYGKAPFPPVPAREKRRRRRR